jgi:hypothetical protein
MDVSIGVLHTGKELSLEMDGSPDDVTKQVDAAVGGGAAVLWLNDSKGRRVGVAVDKIAYIEIADDDVHKRVGFGRG